MCVIRSVDSSFFTVSFTHSTHIPVGSVLLPVVIPDAPHLPLLLPADPPSSDMSADCRLASSLDATQGFALWSAYGLHGWRSTTHSSWLDLATRLCFADWLRQLLRRQGRSKLLHSGLRPVHHDMSRQSSFLTLPRHVMVLYSHLTSRSIPVATHVAHSFRDFILQSLHSFTPCVAPSISLDVAFAHFMVSVVGSSFIHRAHTSPSSFSLIHSFHHSFTHMRRCLGLCPATEAKLHAMNDGWFAGNLQILWSMAGELRKTQFWGGFSN